MPARKMKRKRVVFYRKGPGRKRKRVVFMARKERGPRRRRQAPSPTLPVTQMPTLPIGPSPPQATASPRLIPGLKFELSECMLVEGRLRCSVRVVDEEARLNAIDEE